jgi:uncharacterized protein YggU (UPF0235/DUF167 family)
MPPMHDLSSLSVRQAGGGSLIRLRVKTKAASDRLLGIRGDARAICALIARVMGVGSSSISIETGDGSADKTIRVEGLLPEDCRTRIGAALSPLSSLDGPRSA